MRHETEKTQSIPKAQRAAETLRGLLEEIQHGFRRDRSNDAGFAALRIAAQSCKEAEAVCLRRGADPGDSLQESLRRANEAAKHFCTNVARRARAVSSWSGCRACSPGGSHLLQELRLPPRKRQLLLRSTQDGNFGEEHLTPIVPRGYILKVPNSNGLEDLLSTSGERRPPSQKPH